jgi:hypothetical protein
MPSKITDDAFVKVSRADLDRRTIAGEIEAGSKNIVLHSWALADGLRNGDQRIHSASKI